jgi:hypothetical protein
MKQDLATMVADQPPLADGLKATRGTFRFKNDLRNHCAIVQPRLYDSAMVTQIILNTDPTGSIPARDTLTKSAVVKGALVVPGQA